AFGRTVTGIAPWLGATGLSAGEEARRAKMARLVRQGLANAVTPGSADKMNFLDDDTTVSQPIVDAAFLAHGLLRAFDELWGKSDADVRAHTVTAMKSIRRKKPFYSNWLLFSAMVEAFLYQAGEDFDEMRVDFALKEFCHHWYLGDGIYGDGKDFRYDYYNSYVIHPMLVQILDTVGHLHPDWAAHKEAVLARASRYAAIQEKLIASDGTFPATGRSICYRMGAFHNLADIALRRQLPEGLSPAAVRCGLTAVLHRCTDAPANYDAAGFLRPGLCGYQPSLREEYINTGSLYLCCAAFLPLGLAPADPFWASPDEDWSGKRIWAGVDYPADHALH
ncbi:DUF2264 domain-containing protein, partial [Ruminococcaceae bacterium OttesenSCG-928-L11]|nr:DUF2264 domain-containing protein [Ruminococcaceae bacterium OttesenSCG-928-L11]